jgi:anti-sigma regulatory factor (Ser/Thr protein kinase)
LEHGIGTVLVEPAMPGVIEDLVLTVRDGCSQLRVQRGFGVVDLTQCFFGPQLGLGAVVPQDGEHDQRHVGEIRCAPEFTGDLVVFDREGADVVVLAATELLTNIWRHAPGSGALTLEFDGGAIRLAVKDDSPRVPVIPQAPPDFNSSRGRGLWLVSEICDSFRFEAITDGTGPGKWAVAELEAK